jgi:hypothetical protein
MKMACANRLSPRERAEDEGEGFERNHTRPVLTLALSLIKGEATSGAYGHSKISAQK